MALGVGGIAEPADERIASKGGRWCEVAHTSTKKRQPPVARQFLGRPGTAVASATNA